MLCYFYHCLEIITIGTNNVSFGDISLLLVEEIGGGILFGWIFGQIGFRLMKRIDHYQTEVLITLAIVMGGYMLAQFLHLSGPLGYGCSRIIYRKQIKRACNE